jgi:hypothetical protein
MREISQCMLSSEVEDSQRASYVQALSFRSNYALAVIHQQQVGMESRGQCDSRSFALAIPAESVTAGDSATSSQAGAATAQRWTDAGASS